MSFNFKLNKLKEYLNALAYNPEGFYCAECGEINHNFDDCGFWSFRKDRKPTCHNCTDWSEYCGER